MITHESSLKEFSSQINFVLDNYSPHGFTSAEFSNVVLGGLGGSGIGAQIVKNWFFETAGLPIEVVGDYFLPAYANEKTFVVLNSYSGNTEETLSLYQDAVNRGCTIVVLSSGGEITRLGAENNQKVYALKPGFQPRQTIGMGLSYLLLIMGDFLGVDLREEVKEIGEKLVENQEEQIRSAERIYSFFASSLKNKFVLLADRQMYPLALRFSQQLNENAKMEAFVNAVPESNHNVLESYIDRLPTNFLLLFTEQNVRVGSRFDFLGGHLEMDNNKVLPLAIPTYDLYTIYDVIYRLDWVSVIAANEVDADLMEVPNIDALKEYLANVEEILEEEEGENE
ncbi:MAG: hypothetical protein JJ975_11765 [Bacteroidia bacterium]|nr:hypothetical protein [Bacteroidia bacterium]